jgi:hypothetical protein
MNRPEPTAIDPTTEPASQDSTGGAKLPYSIPRITCWGDLRTLTLGGSPGQFDSANPNFTAPQM